MVALGGFQQGGISMNEAGLPICVFRVGVHAPLICACPRRIARFLFAPVFLAAETLSLENASFPIIRVARYFLHGLTFEFGEQVKFHLTSEFLSRVDSIG